MLGRSFSFALLSIYPHAARSPMTVKLWKEEEKGHVSHTEQAGRGDDIFTPKICNRSHRWIHHIYRVRDHISTAQ